MKKFFKRIASLAGTGARAFVVLVGIAGIGVAVANYNMTQGVGIAFGSVVVGGIHYAQQFICDLTAPAQCASVSAGGAVKVDGSAVTQPVSNASLPLPAGASTSANQATEIASLATIATAAVASVPYTVNGTPTAATALTPGVAQTGTIVAPNSDQTSMGGVAYGAMANFGTSPGAVKVPGANVYNYVTDQVGAAAAALVGDPCQTTAKTTLPITLATAAVKVIAVGVSAKKIYVCQLNLNNNAADTVAVFEATTATVCATSPVAVVGAGTTVATAGTGYNFGATGGISLGNGAAQVLQTANNANDLCIAQSAATQLTGSITYVTR